MITFEDLMTAKDRPDLADLNVVAFSRQDIINLILQRSEIIRDQPRPWLAVRAWTDGDQRPLAEMADRMGDELIYRALAIIQLEYAEIADAIAAISPRRAADIGCGYALFDYFLWCDQGCDLVLVDLESSDERRFGFNDSGAAYSSLAVARQFLTDNGVPESAIACVNPGESDVMGLPAFDLVTSFVSCGFHYPVSTYEKFFQGRVRDDGAIILDIRKRRIKTEKQILDALGPNTVLADAAYGKASRFLTTRRRRVVDWEMG